jgi:nucleoside-diphosphate-sugar epimerase
VWLFSATRSEGSNGRTMRVFITGATGFVGGALARALAAEGAEVHALVRPASSRASLTGVPVQWHEGDITDPESLSRFFSRAEWVIHSAGQLGQAGLSEEVYQQLNVVGTRNVLAAAMASGVRPRVLHISSPGVLGPTGKDLADESAPVNATNWYEKTKAAAEEVVRFYAAQGLPVTMARPGFIYGPGDKHVLRLFQAVKQARFFYIDGGEYMCHPTFICDAVNGMLLCLRQGQPGEPYHILGPKPVSFRELGTEMARAMGVRAPRLSIPKTLAMLGAWGLEVIGKLAGKKPPLTRTGVDFFGQDRQYSWEKAHRELGYRPNCELPEGIAQTVAWYRQQSWI